MIKPRVKIEGSEELNSKFEKIVEAMGYDKVEDILYKKAEIVRDTIRDKAPLGPTGNLRRSAMAKRMPPGRVPIVIAGIDRRIAPHAHLLEFGTVKMSAKPFFRPAWDSVKDKINRDLAKEFGKAIEAVTK